MNRGLRIVLSFDSIALLLMINYVNIIFSLFTEIDFAHVGENLVKIVFVTVDKVGGG